MFGSGNFEDKSPLRFLENLKFKIFKNALWQFIPIFPPKNVITSTIDTSTASNNCDYKQRNAVPCQNTHNYKDLK